MSRKKYNPRKIYAFKGEQSPFAVRLSKQMKEHGMTQTQVAEHLGVQRQTVSLYTKGQALPDISTLAKITELFDVSADYLLGTTEAVTFDTDKRVVCDTIHLSEEAIEKLIEVANDKSAYIRSSLKIISKLLERDDFFLFIDRVKSICELNPEGNLFERIDIDFERYQAIGTLMQILKEIEDELA
jgi:transcriptional regulator with XRE-family HTH domain